MSIILLAGLPRSGSTLLCGLLNQHPKLKVSEASTLLSLLNNVRKFWSNSAKHKATSKQDRLIPVLKSIVSSYHDLSNNNFVVDKDREWLLYLDLVYKIFPQKPKIIVTVRNPIECIASFDRLKQQEPETYTQLEEKTHFNRANTYSRADSIAADDGALGLAYLAIFEAAIVQERHADMLFVDYDKLCNNPEYEMNRIFSYLEILPIDLDFKNIKNAEIQRDEFYRSFDRLHELEDTIRPVNKDVSRIKLWENQFSQQFSEFWKQWT